MQANKHVSDLFEDLRDGHNLISLLEVLSGELIVSLDLPQLALHKRFDIEPHKRSRPTYCNHGLFLPQRRQYEIMQPVAPPTKVLETQYGWQVNLRIRDALRMTALGSAKLLLKVRLHYIDCTAIHTNSKKYVCLCDMQSREKGRMRFHMLQNVQRALDFLKYRKVSSTDWSTNFTCVTDYNAKYLSGSTNFTCVTDYNAKYLSGSRDFDSVVDLPFSPTPVLLTTTGISQGLPTSPALLTTTEISQGLPTSTRLSIYNFDLFLRVTDYNGKYLRVYQLLLRY
ncbi:MACF1 [Cordylochernes scorpioides]|uniref:MACF1 n=1 Tax=Cordylochernes scorpioides TaxID=51811 RepID=A0ABY6KAP0_9ARAC|nr:MACF1 [Cordylochernes scorpioides]